MKSGLPSYGRPDFLLAFCRRCFPTITNEGDIHNVIAGIIIVADFYLTFVERCFPASWIQNKPFFRPFVGHKCNIPITAVAVTNIIRTAPFQLTLKHRYNGADLLRIGDAYGFSVMIDSNFAYLCFGDIQYVEGAATKRV